MQEFQSNDTICNRYKVLRKLGAGSMGSVYLCEDSVEKNIKVALKVLISDNLDDQDIWAKGEYEALTRLRHPNLARVYNFGCIGDSKDYYIVSEFIKGIDLYSGTEYLHYDEITDIVVQICRALEYIHSQGYVHFDIKPDNILVTRYKTVGIKEGSKVQYTDDDFSASKHSVCSKPNVKVIDFGLAEKITGSFSFAIKGTLNYLAPEILNGHTPDKRADLYSLGVTLYQIANRDLPLHQERVDFGDAAPVAKRSDLFEIHMKKHPEFLRALILKLLEENPQARFQSAKEVIQFINRHSEYDFEVETAETRASYFYSAKLIGRRKELNLLKEYHEKSFFPQRWSSRVAEKLAKGEASATLEESSSEEPADDLPEAGDAASDASAVQQDAGKPDLPALILMSGEMGSGKSRLLEEFQHFLKLNDLSLFVGNCYEGNRKAYQPIVEALRQLVYSFGLDADICQKYRHDILKLLPEIRTKRDEDEAKDGFRPDKEKLYFIERISQLLIEAAQISPYVLVINNLHWMDEASVDLLENFLGRIADMRRKGEPLKLLVFASLRPEEPLSGSVRNFLDELRGSDQCRDILVRRLKQAHILELLRSMLNISEVPEAFVTKLGEKTAGNPLFIVETLKALQDDGIVKNVGDGWVVRATNYDRIEIPQSMEDLLEKRLSKFDDKKRDLLHVLSVLDKPANPKFLKKLKRFEDVPILVQLRELEKNGIVTKIFENGKLHFQISQPKVREILYSSVPEETRCRYHGEVGDALQDLYRGKEDEILEELAYHYQRSDLTKKALELAMKAGDGLKAIYANERAYEYYSYVLEKVGGDPQYMELWAETHEKLGDLCLIMGRYDDADQSYRALLDDDMRDQLDSWRMVKVFLARGKVFEIQGDYEQALKCFKDARNYLADSANEGLVVERIRVFNSIGWVYVCMGKYEKAMAISLEALRVIEKEPDRIEHAMVYNTIGSANFYKGNIREAIEYHRRSLQIKENLENIPEITISLNNLGSAHMAGTEYGEASELFKRSLRTSEEIGDPYGKAVTLHNFARLYFFVGLPDKGWAVLDESLKLSKQFKMRYLNIQNYIERGKALRDQGDLSKAAANFFRGLAVYSKQGHRWGLSTVLLQLAELHRLGSQFSEARAMLMESKRYAEELGIHNLRSLCYTEESRLLRDEGKAPDEALKLLEKAIVAAEKCENAELSAEVNYEIGETMVRMRRLRDAPRYYKAAEEKYREVYESLPKEFRASYSSRQEVRFRSWRSGSGRTKPAQKSQVSLSDFDEPLVTTEIQFGSDSETAATVTAEESLRRVNDLMVLLCAGGSLQDFLKRFLDEMIGVLRAEAAFLLQVDGENVSVEFSRAQSGKTPGEPEKTLCLSLIEKVLAEERPILLGDLADDPEVETAIEEQGLSLTSLAVVPLSVGSGQASVLYALNPQLPRGGGDAGLKLLQPFVNLIPLACSQLKPETHTAV
jgi:serine/threonine protein kinase/tetratricopeptide (TPR) repeat protein